MSIQEVLSRVGAWGKTKLWPFLKAHWKIILAVVATIVALWAGKKVINVVGNLLEGFLVPQVKSPLPFAVIDKDHISVHNADGSFGVLDTKAMGLDASKVKAVGSAEGGKVEVSIENPPLK